MRQGNLLQGLLFILCSLNFESRSCVLGLLMEDQVPLPVLRPYCTVIPCLECHILFPLTRPECRKRPQSCILVCPSIISVVIESDHVQEVAVTESERCLANAIIERITFWRRNVRLDAAQF